MPDYGEDEADISLSVRNIKVSDEIIILDSLDVCGVIMICTKFQ